MMFEPKLIDAVERITELLPENTVQIVIETLLSINNTNKDLYYQLTQKLPNQALRRYVVELIDIWQEYEPNLPIAAIALALQSTYNTRQKLQKEYAVQPVWTIPKIGRQWIRQTEQVILEIISQSQSELLLISFAVYHIPQVAQALTEALKRNVSVMMIVELPKSQKISFGIFESLSPQLLQHLDIFYWPQHCRPKDSQGKYGSLHMKGIIGDRQQVLITSANLTDYALNLNMELGLMTRQPQLAKEIYEQFEILIQQDILLRLDSN